MKNSYKILNSQEFREEEFSLVPIRFQDRYKIMKWRNEQLYHLRQSEPLSKEKQDYYFDNVVANLFDQEKPDQLLFSFLKEGKCIGYGGLVHINWIDKNAEVSFIMDTKLERSHFCKNWTNYLLLLEKLAFDELKLNKIYTYAYDIRPHLIDCLEKNKFFFEARLKRHVIFENKFYDVLIHGKWTKRISLQKVSPKDLEITYEWAVNPEVRKFSFNKEKIKFEDHKIWFLEKLEDKNCFFYIAYFGSQKVGSFRLDIKNNEGLISFLLDPSFHGFGLGLELLNVGVETVIKEIETNLTLIGLVMRENKASMALFEKLNFQKEVLPDGNFKFTYTNG